jgi:hypothetical protein
LSNPEVVKRYIQMRRGSANMTAAERGNAVMSMMTEAAAEAGVDAGSAGSMASKVGSIVRGIGNAASQTSRVAKQTAPRIAMQSPDSRGVPPERTRTSVPEVSIPQDFEMIVNPEYINQQQSLRDRAKANPYLASTLLGGLGNAGLLNRP